MRYQFFFRRLRNFFNSIVVYVQPPAIQTPTSFIFLAFSPKEKHLTSLSHSSVLQIMHVKSVLAKNEIISMNQKLSLPFVQPKMLLIQLGLFQKNNTKSKHQLQRQRQVSPEHSSPAYFILECIVHDNIGSTF